MNKILVTGITGQVGQELQKLFGDDIIPVGRNIMDLTQPDSIRQVIGDIQPNIIINAAAYTAVDKAESEIDLANAINGTAPTIMAEAAQKLGATLIHLSTDYVFNGQNNTPYLEDQTPDPIGTYGKSKLLGEEGAKKCDHHIILRTAWVYGARGHGNFVKTMLRVGANRDELKVVTDQIGSPTWSKDIAVAIKDLISVSAAPGIYHFTSSGVASWYDFAVAIFEEAKKLGFPLQVQKVIPINTAEYPTPAKRPAYSVLSIKKFADSVGHYPPYWRDSLKQMLEELYQMS